MREFVVEELKTRLDKYLAGQLVDISRSQIQRGIEGGSVEVNEQIITKSKFVVRQNDKVKYQEISTNTQPDLKPANIPLKILYNNHGLVIIDKPAGLVVHPGAGFKGETLASALVNEFKNISPVGEQGRPGVVHRLDKDTSGVILAATTQGMYEYLKDAFAERKVKKEYIALVLGKMEKFHGFIETPIGKSKNDFRKYDIKNIIEPKQALTEYQVLEYLSLPKGVGPVRSQSRHLVGAVGAQVRQTSNGVDEYTLVLIKLHTGRTHQIRVHLKSIGHPIMGDRLYGGKKSELSGLHRQFLHAKKIEVRLPDKTWIEAEAEFPQDLKEVLKNLNSKTVKKL